MEKNEQIIRELGRVIDEANSSNWIPLTVVLSCLALVSVLVYFIVTRELKNNTEKHKKHEEEHDNHSKLINQLVNVSVEQKLIIKELQIITKFHDREIQEIKKTA